MTIYAIAAIFNFDIRPRTGHDAETPHLLRATGTHA